MTGVRLAILRAWAPRALVLWLGVRAVASAVLLLGGVNPLAPAPARSVLIVLVTVTACLAQTARGREWAFLGNLGVEGRTLAAMYVVPGLVGELLLGLLALLFR